MDVVRTRLPMSAESSTSSFVVSGAVLAKSSEPASDDQITLQLTRATATRAQ
jgi:hypothetical protein